MTVINNGPKEALNQIRERSGKKKRGRNFLIIFMLIILVLSFSAAVVVAKSGIFNIPLISSWFYEEPKPIREVKATNAGSELIFKSSLSFSQSGLSLKFSENDLTALIIQGLGQSPLSDVQAAINSEDIELFGRLESPVEAYLTINIEPKVADGKLSFDLKKIKVGDISLPVFLIGGPVSDLLNEQFSGINETIGKFLDLKDISVREGELEIFGSPIKP